MITVDINNDPNFVKNSVQDPRDFTVPWNVTEENAIINEYFNQICGISEAIDTVAVLEEIHEKIQASENPDPQTLRIAQITVEHLCSSLNVENTTYSMESFSSGKKAALEGLGSWISAFFKAIIKAVTAVIDFVIGFFKPTQREKVVSNRKEIAKEIKAKRSAGAKADTSIVTNKIFATLDPFTKVSNDQTLTSEMHLATVSVGNMASIIKSFNVFIQEIVHLFDNLTVNNVDTKLTERDAAAIAANDEWNTIIVKLGNTNIDHPEHHKTYIEHLVNQHRLNEDGKRDKMSVYEGFVNGDAMISYQRSSTQKNYDVTHFGIIKADPEERVAIGDYEISDLQSFEKVVEAIDVYAEQSEKMAQAIESMADPLRHFLSVLKKVENIFKNDSNFKPTPLLHIGKVIASQATSFQQFMVLVDQTGLQQVRMMSVVKSHYL